MAQSVARQWPALPAADPEQLRNWAAQITKLLQEGAIVDGLGPGDVVGPAGSVGDSNVALFDGTTGELLKDSGKTLSSSGNRWNVFASVSASDGGMEIGKYIDFHDTGGDTGDFAMRLDSFSSPLGFTATVSGAGTFLLQMAGKQSIWVPATAMWKNNGAAGPAPGQLVVSSSNINYLAYDPAGIEDAFFNVAMPKSWNLGQISARFFWTHPATATNFTVHWQLFVISYADNDPIAGVGFGGPAVCTDTGGTTNASYISPESSPITVGSTPAAHDWLNFLARRDATAGGDNLAVDAHLIGVMIYYTTNAPNDL